MRRRDFFGVLSGMAAIWPIALQAQERILSVLSREERTMLLVLLTRVVEANQAYARPGNGRRKPRSRADARNPANPDAPT